MKKQILIAVVSLCTVIAAGIGGFFLYQAKQPPKDARLDSRYVRENERKADYRALHTLLAEEKPINWLFAGDSITHGCYHTGYRRNFSELFEQYIKTEANRPHDIVVNTGVSGATTAELTSLFSNWIEAPQPDIAFICFGMNDCTGEGMTVEQYDATLRDTVARLRAMGAIPILQTPNTSNRQKQITPYVEAVRTLAQEESVLLVDANSLWKENAARARKWMSDALHPNAAGHLVWSRFLLESLGLPVEGTKLGGLPIQEVSREDCLEDIGHWQALPINTKNAQALRPYVENESPVTWVFAGGASTQGVRQSYASRNFVQHLQEVLRWQIADTPQTHARCYKSMINVARDGETVADLLAQYDLRIGQFKPQVLFLMPEPLDAQGNWVESEGATFAQQLTALIRRAQAGGATVILALPAELTDRAAALNRVIGGTESTPGVAQENGVLLVGNATDVYNRNQQENGGRFMTSTGCFTELGQRFMAMSMLHGLVLDAPKDSRLMGS